MASIKDRINTSTNSVLNGKDLIANSIVSNLGTTASKTETFSSLANKIKVNSSELLNVKFSRNLKKHSLGKPIFISKDVCAFIKSENPNKRYVISKYNVNSDTVTSLSTYSISNVSSFTDYSSYCTGCYVNNGFGYFYVKYEYSDSFVYGSLRTLLLKLDISSGVITNISSDNYIDASILKKYDYSELTNVFYVSEIYNNGALHTITSRNISTTSSTTLANIHSNSIDSDVYKHMSGNYQRACSSDKIYYIDEMLVSDTKITSNVVKFVSFSSPSVSTTFKTLSGYGNGYFTIKGIDVLVRNNGTCIINSTGSTGIYVDSDSSNSTINGNNLARSKWVDQLPMSNEDSTIIGTYNTPDASETRTYSIVILY